MQGPEEARGAGSAEVWGCQEAIYLGSPKREKWQATCMPPLWDTWVPPTSFTDSTDWHFSLPHTAGCQRLWKRNASEFISFVRCDIFLLLLGPSVKVTYSAKSFQEYMLNGYLFSSMRLEGDDERFKIKLHYRDLCETRRVMREYLKSNTIPGVEALAIISEGKGELQ